jgi:hypothetical protein
LEEAKEAKEATSDAVIVISSRSIVYIGMKHCKLGPCGVFARAADPGVCNVRAPDACVYV